MHMALLLLNVEQTAIGSHGFEDVTVEVNVSYMFKNISKDQA